MNLEVFVVQLAIFFGEPEKNWLHFIQLYKKKVAALARTAACQLVVLPELWLTGYDFPFLKSLSPADYEHTKIRCQQFAKEHDTFFLAGSLCEVTAEGCYNTAFLFAPDGSVVGKYRKQQLFPLMDEQLMFNPGTSSPVFSTPFGTVGILVCYDLRFPEISLALRNQGADILLVPAEFPHPRQQHWKTLLQARSIEHQAFVVGANCSAADPNLSFCGTSLIFDPWGVPLAEAGGEETIICATLNLATVAEVRQKIPMRS